MTLSNSTIAMGLAMKAENYGYSDEFMNMIMCKLKQENESARNAILDFWHYLSDNCGFMLYCEIMKRLEPENKQAISYLV